MKYFCLTLFLLTQNSINCQTINIDSIDFYYKLKFEQNFVYASTGKLEKIEYISKIQNIKKIDFFDSRRKIFKDQIWQNEILQEIHYTYYEQGQVIKRYDILKNMELPPVLNLNYRHPAMARENNIEGKIFVKFIYNNQCIPIDFKILNSLGYGIDEEVNSKMKVMIHLSKKYRMDYSKCLEIEVPYIINFNL